MLALAVAGCDSLLEVDLPDAVTVDTFDNPATAALQVNSVMAGVECAYSTFAMEAGGFEDNFQRVSGVAGLYSEYRDTPGGGSCDEDSYSQEWIDPFLIARNQGYETYDRLSAWTDAEVANREELLAQTALYTAIPLDVFGEYFCEMSIEESDLMTPVQTLQLAEDWVNTALEHIANTGDFEIDLQQGTVTTSAETMAYGLLARIRWARGDLEGAANYAAMVPDDFVAWVLREDGEDRRNMVSSTQGGGGGIQAAGFLQGPIKLKTGTNDYGVSSLGPVNPATNAPWPNPVPFTGYIDLGIDATTGVVVTDAGYPITTDQAGTVDDPRVTHAIGNTAGGPDYIVQKYPNLSDDIPLVNWREMRLIQAEYANEVQNNQAAAIGFINELRTAANIPTIASTAYSQDYVEDMIIEERRRALWLEGRFWATKIQNTDKLWFPRAGSDWINQDAQYPLGGGVRLLMPEDEYEINPNLTLADRGTGCTAAEAPVYN
jgi:hypothetical protein